MMKSAKLLYMKNTAKNTHSRSKQKIKSISAALDSFFAMEATGGILLIAASVLALILANSPLAETYQHILHIKISVLIGDAGLSKSFLHWINDGLMAIFFFLVGLEVKRELVRGELSSVEQAALPVLAAIGGIIVPVAFFMFFNHGQGELVNGWAIPTATDIAFALGIMTLLGDRVPTSLKILLTAIAVIDDIAAVLIIAFFYTSNLSMMAMTIAAVCVCALFAVNRMKVNRTAVYILIGFILWVAVLKSGVHATLAGVVTALFIPLSSQDKDGHAIAEKLEHNLHPWVAFLILPLFAFANAGVPLMDVSFDMLTDSLSAGIITGLFIGKPLGVMLMIGLAVACGFAKRPDGASWMQIFAVAVLCGVGFTMSLFIGTLAFETDAYEQTVRLGVLIGSFLAAITGYLLLHFSTKQTISNS